MGRMLCVLSLAAAVCVAGACAAETVEFRGLFVDAFHPGIKSHEEVTRMVKAAKDANLNALIVQVRKRGDAYYDSKIEPRASDIAVDYDPLADVIKQAHAAGLEVHAMLNVTEVAYHLYTLSDSHVSKAHPEWLMALENGETNQYGRIYVDPCVPQAQDYFVSIIADVASRYDVDGIHLEGCWYVRREGMYNGIALALFQEESGRGDVPKYDDPTWCDWRRGQVTQLVRKVHDKLAEIRPRVKLSATACGPTPEIAAKYLLQEYGRWTEQGLVDSVVPLAYEPADSILASVEKMLPAKHQRHMYVAIGTYQLSAEKARGQIADVREAGADGVALFNYHYLVEGGPDRISASDLAQSVFATPAVVPPMDWR